MKCDVIPVEDYDLLELAQRELGFERIPEEQIEDEPFLDLDYLDENQDHTYSGNEEDYSEQQDPDGLSEDNRDIEPQDTQNDTLDMVMDQKSAVALCKFINRNLNLFTNKIVLDVGCCCGILSQYCIQAGASLVIATGNECAAEYVMVNATAHGYGNVFVPMKGPISEIELPFGLTHVDVIVSEWIGHSVFVGSRFKDVLYARDKWLVKGGLIFPNIGKLYMSGLYDNPIKYTEGYQDDTIEDDQDNRTHSADADNSDWEDDEEDDRPMPTLLEAHVGPVDVISEKFLLKSVDLYTAQADEDCFNTPFKLRILEDGILIAFALHSEIWVSVPKQKAKRLFSTGPMHPVTYLKQTVLILERQRTVVKDTLLKGVFGIYHNQIRRRGVEFSLGLRGGDFDPDLEPKTDSGTEEYDFYSGIESLGLLFGEEPMAEPNFEVDLDSGAESHTVPEF
ncbi:protein arginine N-methyltransferase 1-like [Drosophila pseudoobscura]|uniref:Protein arginine N-methyltransferase 1-like n=1 Tax=Drosophila pseudoobscura pseudoobscura TaxID=46245 RepID=A0A6I8V2K3_DROPS|nr:protein arginine N-methyltransferase 1 [Drosophila pseudoobscura]